MDASFYVGDAAGRSGDHAGTDRKFASNAGLRFFTPEVRLFLQVTILNCAIASLLQEYFLNLKPGSYTLKGFSAPKLVTEGELIEAFMITTS